MKKRLFTICGLSICMAASFAGCGEAKTVETEVKTEANAKIEIGEGSEITETAEEITEATTVLTTEATTEAVTEAATEETSEKSEDSDMAPTADLSEYAKFVNDPSSFEWEKLGVSDQTFNWDSYQLIEVDGDETPEMIVTCKDQVGSVDNLQHYLILDNTDNGLVITELADGVASAGGYRGTLYYLPGKSTIYDISNSAPYAAPGFTLYKSENGKIEYVESAYFDPEPDAGEDALEHGKWYWGTDEVTKEEYDEKLNEKTENPA